MSSDLQEERGAELEPKKTSGQILQHEIQEGRTAIRRPVGRLFLSGLSAGLDIGFSLFLIAVAMTRLDGVLPPPVLALLTANLYAVGFIFVVVGRSELFTEQPTLAVLPVLNGKATITHLFRTWGVVYCANLAGAAVFAALAVVIGPALGIIDSAVFGRLALSFTEADGVVILMSGLLAGWLKGLLSWLVAASRDTISQIVLTWLIATVIGYTRLHYVVVGSVEVLAGVFSAQEVLATKYLHFLFWTTIGNSIGGPFFVAIIKYSHAIGGESGIERGDQLTFDRTGGAERDMRFQERFW